MENTNNLITPEELKEARKAADHFNRFFGYEFFTPESYIEMGRRIDKRLARHAYNEAMAAVEAQRRKVEMHSNRVHITIRDRTFSLPQPTLLFFKLYRERRGYIDDPDHGLGRLLTILKRQKEPGYIRALRAYAEIPDIEAQESLKGINPKDRDHYYYAVKYAGIWGQKITEKKTEELFAKRMGLDPDVLDGMLQIARARPS